MDVHVRVLANDTVPGKDVGLCWLQGLGNVHWHRPISIKVFHKLLHTDDFGSGPGGGGGEVRVRRLGPSTMGWGLGVF